MESAANGMEAERTEAKEEGGLSLVEQWLTHVPESVGLSKGLFCVELNLKSNRIVSLAGLSYFKHLQVLILDDNRLEGIPKDCPALPTVKSM